MKKVLSLVASLVLAMTLVGCGQKETPVEPTPTPTPVEKEDDTVIRLSGLMGPTGFALSKIMADNNEAEVKRYETSMSTPAETNVKLEKGEIDIAALPANVASVMYNKLDGKIKVLNINTYGVLYVLGFDDSVKSFKDLDGKTIYSTGKGGTPEVAVNYLTKHYGITPNVEYKADAAECLAFALKDPKSFLMVPEPFVTSAVMKNPDMKVLLSMNDEWKAVTGMDLVTGTMVVRTEFLEEHPTLVEKFMEDFENSINFTNNNLDEASKNIVELGIVPKEQIAKKAIPRANLVNITGDELEETLGSYLEIVASENPKLVGGKLPDKDFYYHK